MYEVGKHNSSAMNAIRELTLEEMDQVAGGNPSATVQGTPIQGGVSWTVTCPQGYQVQAQFNPNTNSSYSTWTNSASYNCVTNGGSSNASFFSQGNGVFGFSGAYQ